MGKVARRDGEQPHIESNTGSELRCHFANREHSMALTLEQFSQQLTSSGLVSDDDLRSWIAAMPAEARPKDGQDCARELVRLKKLTKFQAEQIFAGKGKSLTLGNYVILDKLGQGGMGMVLKAEHKRMKRLVALKVMSPQAVKTPDALKRFHREVEAAARLTHPNIVNAFDADEAKGTHFLVMEYVEGSDLSALVKKHGPLPVEQAVQCIIQAARGLAFAHEQGVIHRDIKPANLLIDAKGTVKILDMGLARIEGAVGGSSEGAGLTSTGTIMGTVDYMSPEQAMDTKHADARSDIYSLGCTLYYLLVGKCLYDGDTMMKKLMAHQHAAIPSLVADAASVRASASSSDASSVGHALDAVFRRMVAKRPEDRPQTMTQVMAELERCLSGGSPTIAIQPSSNTTTSGLSVGSGNELQDFLRQISGGEISTATRTASAGSKGTAVAPSSVEAETMISSAGDGGTDPRTLTSVTEAGSLRRVSRQKLRGRNALLVTAGVVLLLLGGLWLFRTPRGVVQIEITDEQVAVTLGETGRIVRGKVDETVKLPVGEYVLHVQCGELEFDTPAISVTKGPVIPLKVERVGNRIRVMRGDRFLASKELPRSKSSGVKPESSSAPNFALKFDGQSHVEIPSLNWNGKDPVTMEFVMSVDDAEAAVDATSVFASWPSPNPGEELLAYLVRGVWAFDARHSTKRWISALHPVRPNERVLLTCIWDGKQTLISANAEQGNSFEDVSNPIAGRPGLWIGGSDGHANANMLFRGTIEQVRVSKGVRTALTAVPAGRLPKEKSTIALYHFGEGRGSTLKDSSGNNHHGKIVGAKWVKAGGTTLQREAIDWLLSMGAQVLVGPNGAVEGVKSYAEYVSKNKPVSVVGLNNAAVTDNDLQRLLLFPEIFAVNLLSPQLGDVGLSHLANLPNLSSLSLSGSQVTDRGLLPLLKCRGLRMLILDSSQLTAESLKTISQFSELSQLGLDGLPVTDASLAELEKLPNLSHLRIHSCKQLTDACGSILARLPKLSTLTADNTELGDEGVRELSLSKSLSILTLYGIKMTNASVPSLSRMTSLNHIDVRQTALTADGVQKLVAALPHCRIVSDHGTIEPRKSIVLTRDKQPAGEFATLAEAFAQLGDDNVIEFHSNGPFAVGALETLGKKSLTMRSAPGYRARITATANESNFVFNCSGTQFLTVEGIEFVSQVPSVWFAGSNMPEQVWEFRNCWLVNVHPQTPYCITFGGAKLRLEDCLLIQRNIHDSLSLQGQVPQRLELVNCVALSRVLYQTLPGFPQFEINRSLRLERNTMHAELHLNLAKSDQKKSTLIEPEGNLFLQPAWRLTGGQIDSPELRWKGRENVYAAGVASTNEQPVIPLASWIGDLKRDEQGSREVDAATPGWAALENADLDQFAKSVLDLAKTLHATHKAGADVSKWGESDALADSNVPSQGLEFDGAKSSVEIPLFDFESQGPLTAEAWFTAEQKPAVTNGDPDAHLHTVWSAVIPKTTTAVNFLLDPPGPAWWCGAGDDRLTRVVFFKFPTDGSRTDYYSTRHHAAFVRDGEEVRLYVDGQPNRTRGYHLDASTPRDPSKRPSEVEKFFLGASVGRDGKTLNRFLRGTIDEFRLSKSARYSAAFVPDQQFPTDASTLVLYHFDEGAGNELKDSSGNNRHGKIVGAKWVKVNVGTVVNDDPDRRAATYVLSVGGKVVINEIPQEYTDVRELPKSRFRLTSIMLHDCKQVSAAGLAACRDCEHLTQFQLSNSADVGDAGLEPFRQCKKLKSLGLAGTGVTDAGLAYFNGCHDLTALTLYEHLVTDLGLANFKDCQKLESLGLAHERMTEKGLGYFQDCRNLQLLTLNNTPLGDGALAQLKSFPKLKSLDFANEGMVTNAGLATLPTLKGLTFLNLTATQVDDAGVEPLKKLTNLTRLHLNGTKMTPAGLAKLKKALPNCKIETDIKP